MITNKAILIRARELINKGFSKNAYARNAKKQQVDIFSKDAVCFCTLGALRRAQSELLASDRITIPWVSDDDIAHIAACMFPNMEHATSVAYSFNDNHTKEEVLAKFDAAIASDC